MIFDMMFCFLDIILFFCPTGVNPFSVEDGVKKNNNVCGDDTLKL